MNKYTAELAADYWKLLQSFKRSIPLMPEDARERLKASIRYSEAKLESIMESLSMRILEFDGMPFQMGLPVVAVNGDDFSDGTPAVVEKTLEPTVVHDMAVLVTGKVFLAKAEG